VAQCNSLIANAHKLDAAGSPLFPKLDRDQITEAGFLNMFKAWETFLESTLYAYMTGIPTLSGSVPTKYVSPPTVILASKMVAGHKTYFDFANPVSFKQLISVYFDNGYPFEPAIGSINSELEGMRTIRNACAHISTNTQRSLETLALRLTGSPQIGISAADLLLYQIVNTPPATVFSTYKEAVLTSAEVIAKGK
jgi:hypothetical protein